GGAGEAAQALGRAGAARAGHRPEGGAGGLARGFEGAQDVRGDQGGAVLRRPRAGEEGDGLMDGEQKANPEERLVGQFNAMILTRLEEDKLAIPALPTQMKEAMELVRQNDFDLGKVG